MNMQTVNSLKLLGGWSNLNVIAYLYLCNLFLFVSTSLGVHCKSPRTS